MSVEKPDIPPVPPGEDAAEFLSSVLVAVPAFVTRLGPDLRIRYINHVQPGLDIARVIGSHVLDYLTPESADVAIACFERVMATGRAERYESVATGAHGSLSTYENYVSPVREEDGRVGLCVVGLDVTEHRTRQAQLEESRAKLRLALEATGIGLWSWDLTSGEVRWDERMKAICGLDEPLRLDDYVRVLAHPDDRAVLEANGRKTFESGRFHGSQHRIVRPDGQERWVTTTGRVLRDETGAITGLMGGNLDVTEQRDVEDQLLQAQKMEAVGNLTAGIAHNFNNMLMVLLPSLDRLAEVVPPSHARALADARATSVRAAALVSELMTFAGQRPASARHPYALDELVDAAAGLCRRTFVVPIRIETAGDPSAVVCCDPGQIEQVLVNVLLNARDAMVESETPDPAVRIATERADGGWVLRVSDNGPGVDEAVRKRMFEPFFTTRIGRGTGLGLATSAAVVRDHGGRMVCESTPGAGTTLRIYLPAAAG